jgi:hypothetical protein
MGCAKVRAVRPFDPQPLFLMAPAPSGGRRISDYWPEPEAEIEPGRQPHDAARARAPFGTVRCACDCDHSLRMWAPFAAER